MRKVIHHLRKQPEDVRRAILHVVVIIAAIILIIFWVYSLGTNLVSEDTQLKLGQDIKSFSALKDNIVNGYNNTKG